MDHEIKIMEIIANQRFAGKYSIICVDGVWKGAFGQSTLIGIGRLTQFYSLESLLADLLFNETSFNNE